MGCVYVRWNYRVFGLYWVGSIGHSMLVLVPGAILSKQQSCVCSRCFFLSQCLSQVISVKSFICGSMQAL